MQTDFIDLFLSTEMIGYIGPFVVVVACVLIMSKNKGLGLVCFMFEMLLIAQYLDLVSATPDYWWQIFILFFGGILPLAFTGLKK